MWFSRVGSRDAEMPFGVFEQEGSIIAVTYFADMPAGGCSNFVAGEFAGQGADGVHETQGVLFCVACQSVWQRGRGGRGEGILWGCVCAIGKKNMRKMRGRGQGRVQRKVRIAVRVCVGERVLPQDL